MGSRLLKSRVALLLAAFALGALLLASLWLMSEATRGSARFGGLYTYLLGFNTLALLFLLGLIGHNLLTLVRQYRHGEPGAHLTGRMVLLFVVLAVVPVTLVYTFSLQFLHRSIDSWFDVRIEGALEDALELGREALDGRMRELLDKTRVMAERLDEIPDNLAAITLDDLRRQHAANELALIVINGPIIAASHADPTVIIPDQPSEGVMLQLRQGNTYVGLETTADGELMARVVVRVAVDPQMTPRVLQALFPMSARMSELAESVQGAFEEYKQLAYLRKPLKQSFTLTLTLVLLASVLTAVWAAFFSARRMVAPIRDLADGTRAVAEGDYDKQLPHAGDDELGFLVRSFNEMTRHLARARDQAKRSRQQVEEQRAYLQTVLGRLSSGVLTFTQALRLHTANATASHILGLPLEARIGHSLEGWVAAAPHLEPIVELLARRFNEELGEWNEMITLQGEMGRQVLMCRGAPLSGIGTGGGFVVVFDEVTALIQAQRNAAWGEVARRLAHEIKNPLTPIQLSAERLRHKFLDKMAPDEAEVLERATRTIVQQVEAMKEMVNAFRDYARAPQLELAAVDLNRLVEEVVELYRGDARIRIETRTDPELPRLEADIGRLRQLLHNLIKNAREAMEGLAAPQLTITTRCVAEEACRQLELLFEDGGPGFPAEILDQLFEPYVTTKTKGTGLGLAIVKKIIEEHGGSIRADNLDGGGARTIIRFPVAAVGEG